MVHHPPQLHWIRPPRQQRTHQGLERILDVAERLLLDKSFDDIHVREVALRADTSVAAFYRRFNDKDGLLHALHERRCEEAFATADDALDPERWAGADIEEILQTIFPFLIEVMQPNESLYRAIYQRAITDDLMRERAMRLNRYVMSGLSELLMARKAEIHHPEPAAAISFALTQGIALLTQQYTVGIRDLGPVSFRDDAIANELARSCLAYLGVLGATKFNTPTRSAAGARALPFSSPTEASIEGDQA
jgi:AcrR family transcriptional regulator